MYSPLFKKYSCGPNIAESLSSIHAYVLPPKKGQISSSWLVKGDAHDYLFFFSKIQTCSCLFRGSFERRSCIISVLLFSVVFLDTRFSGITQCAFPTIVKSRPRHQLEIMHQSIPAAPRHHRRPPPPPPPPLTPGYCGAFVRLVSPGEGHLQILRCSGPGICQLLGQPRTFDRHAVSYQNIPTRRILMEKQADCHLSRRRKNCKGMFSIWCMHLFIAY